MMSSGSLESSMEAEPRRRIRWVPPEVPDPVVMDTPVVRACKSVATLVTGATSATWDALTEETEAAWARLS
jgi:hypothetical protein